MASYVLSPAAHFTLLAHVGLHPTSAVLGLLLASSSTSNESVEVTRALPLVHHWTALTPQLDVSIALAIQHVKKTGLKIVGLYAANEATGDELSPMVERIAKALASSTQQADVLVAVLKPRALPSSAHLTGYRVSTSNSGSKQLGLNAIDTGAETRTVSILRRLQAGTQDAKIAASDWDDHLEDTSIDWLAPLPAEVTAGL
ncbi:hypothetical protein IE81DRAFT_41433 [Ceraceosorus guamensis]|uniref:MPN domain-containing protein n=1 Tax=Ceraceosorus guamensis TaxID=1522189 RepID=A0A316VNS3_9BASI|nr:hypothetical protein IE81DRAFT_41433 [Ceraceosorus guamensis]PWN39226.1 hypothetical protein IE81DRAFT_41433 [Ceraceosorus guamensis]